MEDTAALVVAAGRGQRFGGEAPKQYLPLGGLPLLRTRSPSRMSSPSNTPFLPVSESERPAGQPA